MILSQEKELWAIALWIEKHYGKEGDLYIAEQMDRLIEDGELEGLALWRDIRELFEALRRFEKARSGENY